MPGLDQWRGPSPGNATCSGRAKLFRRAVGHGGSCRQPDAGGGGVPVTSNDERAVLGQRALGYASQLLYQARPGLSDREVNRDRQNAAHRQAPKHRADQPAGKVDRILCCPQWVVHPGSNARAAAGTASSADSITETPLPPCVLHRDLVVHGLPAKVVLLNHHHVG
eukprot:5172323-Amphidinium_carterae.1